MDEIFEIVDDDNNTPNCILEIEKLSQYISNNLPNE